MSMTNDREDGNDCSDDNANSHLQEVPLMVNRCKQWKFYSSSVVVVLVPLIGLLISIIISMKVHPWWEPPGVKVKKPRHSWISSTSTVEAS